MPAERVREFLDQHHVGYELIPHRPAFTAQETAAAAHIPGKQLAKTVIVAIDGKWAMVVLPASDKLNLDQLQRAVGAREVYLPTEDDFRQIFPDCEPGAMPPFGNLYGMTVFVDQHLREDAQIAFNAGSHAELIRIPYDAFERLVNPIVATLHS